MERTNPVESRRGPEHPDPNARLQQLQAELADHERRLGHISKQTDALKADITDLTQTVAEVKTTLAAYGGQVGDLETHFHALQYFYDQKHKMVMAAIGDKKGPIDDLIRDFDSETEKMEDRLAELAERQEHAQHESDEATAAQTTKQAEYDAIRNYPQKIQKTLGDLDTLSTAIKQADDKSDIASMYFLVLEFHHTLEHTEVLSQHRLAQELRDALAELEQAKEHARSRSAELANILAEYAAHQTALDNRKQGREQYLLGQVQKMYPAPAQPAQQASASAGGSTGAGSADAKAK